MTKYKELYNNEKLKAEDRKNKLYREIEMRRKLEKELETLKSKDKECFTVRIKKASLSPLLLAIVTALASWFNIKALVFIGRTTGLWTALRNSDISMFTGETAYTVIPLSIQVSLTVAFIALVAAASKGGFKKLKESSKQKSEFWNLHAEMYGLMAVIVTIAAIALSSIINLFVGEAVFSNILSLSIITGFTAAATFTIGFALDIYLGS